MVLGAIYEEDFLDCSYAYRPGRSAHGALQQLRDGLMEMGGGWVYEVDIKAFFDTLDHKHLRSFLDQRVNDGPIRWTIDKWLAAGVMEEGAVRQTDEGTPQGGVISPMLANVYLHEVLDKWFERDVKPRMKGRVLLVRYADDFVMGFEREEDARKVAEVLPKRFTKYGLTVHPTKTRLLYFGRPPKYPTTEARKLRKPETFDFLAFTHYWGRSEKGNLGHQAEDGTESSSACGPIGPALVQEAPALGAQGAVETTEREAERLLQLLWSDREHPCL
jgi:RNA-directed DNA polymerase